MSQTEYIKTKSITSICTIKIRDEKKGAPSAFLSLIEHMIMGVGNMGRSRYSVRLVHAVVHL
jgi:hypothetical protein